MQRFDCRWKDVLEGDGSVNVPQLDRGLGHAVDDGGIGILRDRRAPCPLDLADGLRAVAAHPGHENASAIAAASLRHRAKEPVHRRPVAANSRTLVRINGKSRRAQSCRN